MHGAVIQYPLDGALLEIEIRDESQLPIIDIPLFYFQDAFDDQRLGRHYLITVAEKTPQFRPRYPRQAHPQDRHRKRGGKLDLLEESDQRQADEEKTAEIL